MQADFARMEFMSVPEDAHLAPALRHCATFRHRGNVWRNCLFLSHRCRRPASASVPVLAAIYPADPLLHVQVACLIYSALHLPITSGGTQLKPAESRSQ